MKVENNQTPNKKRQNKTWINGNLIKNQSGFSMVEILISSAILISGILMYFSYLGNYVERNEVNERKTIALVQAQEKLEDLKNLAGSNVLDNTNDGNDTVAGAMNRSWTITNGGAGNLSTLAVTVAWTGALGNRTVTLTTLLSQSNGGGGGGGGGGDDDDDDDDDGDGGDDD